MDGMDVVPFSQLVRDGEGGARRARGIEADGTTFSESVRFLSTWTISGAGDLGGGRE